MFSALFASFAALVHATDGGPAGQGPVSTSGKSRSRRSGLLLSSFTCGLAFIAARRGAMLWTQAWLVVTGILGFIFLAIELREFATMIAAGAGPQRSAFSVGVLHPRRMSRSAYHGRPAVDRHDDGAGLGQGLHAAHHAPVFSASRSSGTPLDIVWVAIFTIVYLMGMAP